MDGDVSMQSDETYMRLALEAAAQGAQAGEVPVGAVAVAADGSILATAHNAPVSRHDPTAHAEIAALRAAAQAIGNYRLTGVSLFVTLEPCAMCAGAIAHARIARLVYAAEDPKGGAVAHGPRFFDQPTCHHRPEVAQGPFGDEASSLLKDFFRVRRGDRQR